MLHLITNLSISRIGRPVPWLCFSLQTSRSTWVKLWESAAGSVSLVPLMVNIFSCSLYEMGSTGLEIKCLECCKFYHFCLLKTSKKYPELRDNKTCLTLSRQFLWDHSCSSPRSEWSCPHWSCWGAELWDCSHCTARRWGPCPPGTPRPGWWLCHPSPPAYRCTSHDLKYGKEWWHI